MHAEIQPPSQKRLSPYIYELSRISKSRESDGNGFRLSVPNLKVSKGEKIALIGESGCGKTTLLDMLALISRPSDSDQFLFTADRHETTFEINALWQNRQLNRIADLRRQHIGYVMQTGGLLPFLNIRDNINLSRDLLGLEDDGTPERVARQLGIERHLKKLPSSLSIGERQRVAIGRAIAHRPAVVIADEPTASLDPYSAKTTMNLFVNLVDDLEITLILASHAWEHLKNFGLMPLYHHTQHLIDSTESSITR